MTYRPRHAHRTHLLLTGCRLAALAAGLSLCACIFEYPDPNCGINDDGQLNVTFDWSADPTARPEGMSVLFYPVDGGNYWRYETGPQGDAVALGQGDYGVVCFNNDTGSVLFENQDDYATALITTRPARLTDGLSADYPYSQPPRREAEQEQPVVSQPDAVWGASDGGFVRTSGQQSITLSPRPLVARYRVTVEEVVNIESAAQVSMAISGLTAGRILSDGAMIPVEVTVPGRMRRTAEAELGGWLLGFGRIDDRGSCLLTIYALLRDGRRMLYEYDVTQTVASAPNPIDVEIRLRGLEFPHIETSGGTGVEVGVDDWEVVEIELST